MFQCHKDSESNIRMVMRVFCRSVNKIKVQPLQFPTGGWGVCPPGDKLFISRKAVIAGVPVLTTMLSPGILVHIWRIMPSLKISHEIKKLHPLACMIKTSSKLKYTTYIKPGVNPTTTTTHYKQLSLPSIPTYIFRYILKQSVNMFHL